MNKIFKYSIGVLFAGLAMTACSPDEFSGADPNGLPTISGVDFQLNVDQETNQMVATFPSTPGVYPIWILNGTQYSTLPEVGYNNPEAGTYSVELKLGNRNGISQAGLKKEFTFNETKVDYSADFRRLCGKEWRIANKEVAHMGCGPAGTAGTEWWAAQPNDKKDFGVYDDRITFSNDTRKGGTYNYNAGADGMTYVNWGTSFNPTGAEPDLDVALGNQTSTWSFEVYDWQDADGNVTKQTYIQLGANTLFPYISSDAQYENPRFRIESLTATKMVLLYETPERSIAWRFILTSAADERLVEEQGFDANSDFNLWKGITPSATFHFQPGWGDVRTSEMEATYNDKGNDYTVTVPDAAFDRWQAQMHLHTDLSISASNHYDFSCIFVADQDIDGVTIKLTNETDADAIIDVDNVSLKAGKEYVFWKSNVEGKDLSPVKLVFDFGHATGATNINISNIVLKDHANDDGTKIPEEGPSDDTPKVSWVAVDSPENLGAGFNTKGEMGFWWADAGWGQVGDPGFSYANGVYTVTAVENGGSEWQAQCNITGVPLKIEKGQGYDVSVKIKANMDLGRVTVKVNKDPDVTNDPNTLCYKGDFSLKDGENVLTFINVVAKNGEEEIEFDQGKIIFDFGGAPAGFVAEISDIIIQKHQVDNNDPSLVDWCAYDSADNLGAGFNTVGTMGFWWADAGWGQVGDPGFSYADGVYTITAVENGGSEWQAQCSITGVPLKIEKGQMYDVSVDIEANMDLPRVTVKVNKDPDITNDPNTLCYKGDFSLNDGSNKLQFAGVIAKNGDEEIEFDQGKIIFDFGGAPAGFVAKISKIIVQKHKVK